MNNENSEHLSEPWNIRQSHDDIKILTQIYSGDIFVASTSTYGKLSIDIEEENAARIEYCVNLCRGISNETISKCILNESTQKIFSLYVIEWIRSNPHIFNPDSVVICNDQPWEWLESNVTADGEGYLFLQSPAGGVMRITNEQRKRIVACINACKNISTEVLENTKREMV